MSSRSAYNFIDFANLLCDLIPVAVFKQSVMLVLFLAFTVLNGAGGVCGVFNLVEISHHHDDVAGDSNVCFNEVEHCDDTHVPCGKADEDLLDEKYTQPSNPVTFFASSVADVATVSATKFSRPVGISEPEFPVRYELFRGSPVNRQIILCRFVV